MRPVSREPFPGNPDNNEEIKKKMTLLQESSG